METDPANSNYSKRELDMKFQVLADKIDDNHKETSDSISVLDRRNTDKQTTILSELGEIKTLALKTNGRVNKNDSWIRGVIMCCSLIIIVVLPLLYIIYGQINSRLDRQSAVISNLLSK